MKRIIFGMLLLLPALLSVPAAADPASQVVTLENESVRLVVNNTDDGRGRFAVDVTGGDPALPGDDGQPLIYGRPVPWTSYTTVSVDGELYAFGGPTRRRAGRDLPTGEIISPPALREGAIAAAWRFGDLEVGQYLTIVEGPTTGRPDTARIAYTIANRGETVHKVGLRVALDTKLGANDGAPFRLGDRQILTDAILVGRDIQPYWQAFDSLNDPRVIAQGTLAGGELTPPDRLLFTNWGTMADAPWQPVMIKGRDFTRIGEFELDSAAALLWDEVELPPGGVLTRVTYYGLGGVTIAKGRLNLGLTAPASVISGEGDRFMILGYVENRGDGVARDVIVSLNAPSSLRLHSPARVELGRLRQGESRQVIWMVEAVGAGSAKVTAAVQAFQLEPISVSREIRLIAPAKLSLTAPKPAEVAVAAGRYQPYPVTARAVVANTGGSAAVNTWVQISPGKGLQLAPGEADLRLLGPLAPGEEVTVEWMLAAGGAVGPARYTVLAGSNVCPQVSTENIVTWPELPKQIKVKTASVDGRAGWYRVDLYLVNLPEAAQLSVRLTMEGAPRLVAVQRGSFLVHDGKALDFAAAPTPVGNSIVIAAERPAPLGYSQSVLATLWLEGEAGAAPRVKLEVIKLLDGTGGPIPVNVVYE